MMYAELRQYKVESCEKTYYKKENKRIGECEEKARHGIFPHGGRMRRILSFLKRTSRIFSEKIYSENSKYNTTKNLQQEPMRFNEFCDEA